MFRIVARLARFGAALALSAGSASAQVVLAGSLGEQGGGLGTQYSLLTVQSPGSTTTESGCITPTGGTSCLSYADDVVKTGAAQTQVQYLDQAGLLGLSGSNLRIVGNFTEQQNASSDVVLDNLQLFLYRTLTVDRRGDATSFQTLFTSRSLTPRPQLLDDYSGIGGFGYVFRLDGDDVDLFDAALDPHANALGTISVGIGVSLANVTGGQESFSLARAGTPPGGSVVPEPSTYVLMASGLLGLAGVARRKKPKG